MNLIKIPVILLAVLVIAGNTSAETNPISISGKIIIKGNEPKTWVALVTADGSEYRLQGNLVKHLRATCQHQQVTLTGTVVSPAKGPGFPAGFKVVSLIE